MDVALSPEEIVADLWVVAGNTLTTEPGQTDRGNLAERNAPLFREYAEMLARHGQGSEVVIVVSNPVELGVALFAQAVGRERVIGIGGYSDTLRFRREIAADLGVRRQRARRRFHDRRARRRAGAGLVVGAGTRHGRSELSAAIARLRRGTELSDYMRLCSEERAARCSICW